MEEDEFGEGGDLKEEQSESVSSDEHAILGSSRDDGDLVDESGIGGGVGEVESGEWLELDLEIRDGLLTLLRDSVVIESGGAGAVGAGA